MAEPALEIWTVYFRPVDIPGAEYVARASAILPGGEIRPATTYAVGATLAEVRAKLPPGLYRLDRRADDEAHIVEVWL